jgi:hypothetical protein
MASRMAAVIFGALVILAPASIPSAPEAAPVAVRYAEGVTHGLLLVRSPKGEVVAHGDLLQVARRNGVESRLLFHFNDGSEHEETVLFSQERAFSMLSYRLVQRGPSFPEPLEASLDGKTGRYTVRSAKSAREDVSTGRIELPSDVSNGMIPMLLKNLAPGASETVHLVIFTPAPRLIQLQIVPAGEERVQAGGLARRATRYVLKPKLGAALRFLATVFRKTPADSSCVILTEDVPAFVRYDGALYPAGPVLRTELVNAR